MKEIKCQPCKICNCETYKVLSEEKYSTVIICCECKSEFAKISDSNDLKLRKRVEKKIADGEFD